MRRMRPSIVTLATALGLLYSGSAGAVQYATPDGRGVIGYIPGLEVGEVSPGLVVPFYLVQESSARPVMAPTMGGGPGALLWGYEAAPGGSEPARMLSYNIGPPIVAGANCVPPTSQNGRGVAYDPISGNLWYTWVTYPLFNGDGYIRKTTPPNTGSCLLVDQIPFADGPGPPIQDDIGALDVSPGSKHLWAAGYKPVTVLGQRRSYFYLLNRNNGKVLQSCWIPFRGIGSDVGNDSLTVAELDGLDGSGEYLITDAGELDTNPNTLVVIDAAQCKGGVQGIPVVEYPKTAQTNGIDFEWPGLLTTDGHHIHNHGGPPFGPSAYNEPALPSELLEDLSLCAFRAVLGGTDECPY